MANRCCLFQAASSMEDSFKCLGCGSAFERSGIYPIKANRIFSLVEESGPDRVGHVRMPKRRERDTEDYSLKLLETYVLVALMRITKARAVFEFGTFLGNTTTNLALNARDGTIIHTLDLDKGTQVESQRPGDFPAIDFRKGVSLDEMEWAKFPAIWDGIWAHLGDSTKFDLSAYFGQIDLVWLDGGRDLRTVESDAKNALQMLSPDRLGAIGWHDYLHPETTELNAFLEYLAGRVPLFHVQDTAMLIYFNQPMYAKLCR